MFPLPAGVWWKTSVRSLGFLCLGSRLKRIGEQLQADTQRLLDGLDVPVQSSQYPLLAALDRLGPLAVGELSPSLGTTQPGVTRSVSHLADLGWSRPSSQAVTSGAGSSP